MNAAPFNSLNPRWGKPEGSATGGKRRKPGFRLRGESELGVPPDEANASRVQRVMRQNEPHPLLVGKPILDQRHIYIFITAVQLVADDAVANVGEVNPD